MSGPTALSRTAPTMDASIGCSTCSTSSAMNAYDPYRPQVQADPSPARAGMDRGCRCQTAYIERGSPWENRYIESFNARLRDELLNGESFYTLREAQFVMDVPMELTQD